LAGEKYSLEALQQYAQKESDGQITSVFQKMIGNKQRHVEMLELRLNQLGEKPSLTANIANQYAKVKTALTGSDDIFQLRSALGDVQTGIGDIGNLVAAFTDPVSTAIFTEIHKDLVMYEQQLVELYRARLGSGVKPANPTTGAAVTM
jgi:protease I